MVTPSPTCAATPKPLGTLPGAMWGVGAPQAGWCTRAGPAALECGVGGAAACLPPAAGGPQVGKDGPGRGGVAPSCGQSRRSGGCASASRCCRHGPAASPPAAQRQAPGGLRWGGGSPPGIPPSLGQQSSHWVPSASPSSGIRPPARPVGCSCIPRSVASYHPTFSTQPCAAGPPHAPPGAADPPPLPRGHCLSQWQHDLPRRAHRVVSVLGLGLAGLGLLGRVSVLQRERSGSVSGAGSCAWSGSRGTESENTQGQGVP